MRRQEEKIIIKIEEKVTAIIASNGDLQEYHTDGEVSIDAYIVSSPKACILFTNKIYGENNIELFDNHVPKIENCQFNHSVNNSSFHTNGNLQFIPIKDLKLLTYEKSDKDDFPFIIKANLFYLNNQKLIMISLSVNTSKVPSYITANEIQIHVPIPINVTLNKSINTRGRFEYTKPDRYGTWYLDSQAGGKIEEIVIILEYTINNKVKEIFWKKNPIKVNFKLPIAISKLSIASFYIPPLTTDETLMDYNVEIIYSSTSSFCEVHFDNLND
uniref:MHD domain-containing protein n=1 Tax=Parastrongyloides trichosuri TaxID=131310 RepID=A0A0N4ZF19_PARTI